MLSTGTPDEELLARVPLFADLDPEALRALARVCRRRRYRAGQALFHQGEPGETLHFIIEGRVRVERVTPSGRIVVLAHRGPGEHVGEMALLDGAPRSADVVTAEPCDVLILDRDAFMQYVAGSPPVAFKLMASLARRLRQAAVQVETLQELDVLGRVSAVLLELTESHGVPSPAGGIRIELKVTQQEIADQIGATRVSVNKALGRLRDVHAIRQEEGHIVVVDPKDLRRYCTE